MRKTLLALSFSFALMPLLTACPSSPLPAVMPSLPPVSQADGGHHLSAFEDARLSPDGMQIYYNLTQETVVNFKGSSQQAYTSRSSLHLHDRAAKKDQTLAESSIGTYYSSPNSFQATWNSKGELVTLESEKQKSQLLRRASDGSKQVLLQADGYFSDLQQQGDWLYFSDGHDKGIQRLNLVSGAVEQAYKFPLDFYQSFTFRFDAGGNLFVTMIKNSNQRGKQPSGFRMACGGFSAQAVGDFKVSCALPPSGDTYLVKPDKSLLRLAALTDGTSFYSADSLTLSPDGGSYSYFDGNSIKVHSLTGDQSERISKQASHAWWLDAGHLALVQDGEARVYDIASRELTSQVSLPFSPSQAIWNAAGKEILLAGEHRAAAVEIKDSKLSYRELGHDAAGQYRLFAQSGPQAAPLVGLHQVPGQASKLYRLQADALEPIFEQPANPEPVVYKAENGWFMRYGSY